MVLFLYYVGIRSIRLGKQMPLPAELKFKSLKLLLFVCLHRGDTYAFRHMYGQEVNFR